MNILWKFKIDSTNIYRDTGCCVPALESVQLGFWKFKRVYFKTTCFKSEQNISNTNEIDLSEIFSAYFQYKYIVHNQRTYILKEQCYFYLRKRTIFNVNIESRFFYERLYLISETFSETERPNTRYCHMLIEFLWFYNFIWIHAELCCSLYTIFLKQVFVNKS